MNEHTLKVEFVLPEYDERTSAAQRPSDLESQDEEEVSYEDEEGDELLRSM